MLVSSCGARAGSWGPGSFEASSAAGSLLFGVSTGTFTFDYLTLELMGPITFSTMATMGGRVRR